MRDGRFAWALFFGLLAAGCGAPSEASDDAESSTAELGETATITFDGAFHQSVSGTLERGKTARVVYDLGRLPTCRGEQGGIPQWSVGGFYAIGDGPVKTFAVGGLALQNGESTAITLDRAGDLKVWFQNTDRWGCNAFDSAYGANYHFQVAPAASDPGWIGNVRYAINRETCNGGTACESSLHAFTGDVTYETYARQRAAIRVVQFDVWKEGVTDHDDADLWKKLDVQVHYRVVGTTAFSTRYVTFDHRVGNDARYAIDLRDLDSVVGFGTITDPTKCPAYPITLVPGSNGAYVEAPVELFMTVNGVELRPNGGTSTYRVRYQNYADLYRPCVK